MTRRVEPLPRARRAAHRAPRRHPPRRRHRACGSTGRRSRASSPDELAGAARRLRAVTAAPVLTLMGWRVLLGDLGTRLPAAPASSIFFVGQLGKYLPGSVWTVVAQAEMGARLAGAAAADGGRRRAVDRPRRADRLRCSASPPCPASLDREGEAFSWWWVCSPSPSAPCCSGHACSTPSSPGAPDDPARAARARALRPRGRPDLRLVRRGVGLHRARHLPARPQRRPGRAARRRCW